jgi:hypothetical protein
MRDVWAEFAPEPQLPQQRTRPFPCLLPHHPHPHPRQHPSFSFTFYGPDSVRRGFSTSGGAPPLPFMVMPTGMMMPGTVQSLLGALGGSGDEVPEHVLNQLLQQYQPRASPTPELVLASLPRQVVSLSAAAAEAKDGVEADKPANAECPVCQDSFGAWRASPPPTHTHTRAHSSMFSTM